MDSFQQYRDLTGIWVDGQKVIAFPVETYDEPDPEEAPAELRISREILAHELSECDVDFGNDLVEFVRKDLTDFGRAAFKGYIDIAATADDPSKTKRGFLKRTFSRPPGPELLLRIAGGVEDAPDVIVIRAKAKRTGAEPKDGG